MPTPPVSNIVIPVESIERIKKFHWDECGVQFHESDYHAIYKIVAADILAHPPQPAIKHGSN